MAVAHDTATESVRTGTTDPHNFSHTPSGTPRGVVVAICQNNASDLVVGVTYGGVTMTRIITIDTSVSEPGRSYLYFLGSSIPAGTQTVSIDQTSAHDNDSQNVCITITANDNTEIVDSDSTFGTSIENPSRTLQYDGRTCISYAALWSGLNSPLNISPGANCSDIFEEDLGNFSSSVIRQTTPGTSNFTIGYTAVADDAAMCAVAISEVIPEAPVRGYKRIYGPAQLGTSAVDLYTVPSGAITRLRRICANNPSGLPVDFTLSVGTDSVATRLYDSYNVPANDSLEWAYDHALQSGEKIQAFAGTSSTLVLTIDAFIEV